MLTYKCTFCMTFLTCKVTQWPTQTTQHDHQSRHNMAGKLSCSEGWTTQKAKKLGINATMLHPHPQFWITFPLGRPRVFWGYNPNSTNISSKIYIFVTALCKKCHWIPDKVFDNSLIFRAMTGMLTLFSEKNKKKYILYSIYIYSI